jgi:hypothetical protein
VVFLWYTKIVSAGLSSKIESFLTAVKGLFKKPAREAPENNRGPIDRIREFLQEKIPGTKERIILICCAAVIIMLVLLGIARMANRSPDKARTAPDNQARIIIAPEELFIPEEPDFIPGVLLEREQRTSWTVDDTEQYWQDPLKDGEEPWRESIENEIDKLMERIP